MTRQASTRTRRGRGALSAALLSATFLLSAHHATAQSDAAKEAKDFISLYSSILQRLYTISAEAEWDASTDVSPEHDGGRIAANKAFSAFAGDPGVIERTRRYRALSKELDPLSRRQLEKIWLAAAQSPGTIPDVVAARVETEARAKSTLDGFQFCLERAAGGDSCTRPITANDIDDILQKSRDLAERKREWEASKEIGPPLRPDLVELQTLRNKVAREMGYSSFFDLQVADYGMTTNEMMTQLDDFVGVTRPLYVELHTWTKHELAKRYGQPVPENAFRRTGWATAGARTGRASSRRSNLDALLRRQVAGVDRREGGGLLHVAWDSRSCPSRSGRSRTSIRCRPTRRARRTRTPRRGTSTSRTTCARS